MSVILKPQGTIHDRLLITTAAAVAVYRAVAQLCGIQLDIKWVNDLFYKGKKVCGILTEAVTDFESGNIIQRVKNMVPLLVPLFISAFRRANDLALAMEARCYHGGEGRTQMKPLRYQTRDYAAYGVLMAYLVCSIGLRVCGL